LIGTEWTNYDDLRNPLGVIATLNAFVEAALQQAADTSPNP
jgi:hypothetical protein